MTSIGIDLGSVSVKAVCLDGGSIRARVVAHQGRPLETLGAILREMPGEASFAVCGRLGHVSEVAAIERALAAFDRDYDAVAALGGEAFTVYVLEHRRVLTVLSHNKCAAGSGEFLVQQVGRMGIPLAEAIALAGSGRLVPLAARCSVHCKSDITHKLNRQEATAADVLYTVHDSMADKVAALLERAPHRVRSVLVIGGVAGNPALIAALERKLPAVEIAVRPESPWLEAYGCALLAGDRPEHRNPSLSFRPSFATLAPLSAALPRVRVVGDPPRVARGHGPLLLGVDAGSTTTKAVLVRPGGAAGIVADGMVASDYRRTHGDPVGATRACLEALAAEVGNVEVALVATTGSGREIVGAYLGTGHVYNEISAHAAGAAAFDSEVDTVFEIGGQDAKFIRLRAGVPVDYAMNAACAAGTGSFLEESASGDLGLDLEAIAPLALRAARPVQFKATCAAFINSDIRVALAEGRAVDDIVAGLVHAIAQNYLGRVKGHRGIGRRIFLQGGVARNRAVAAAFAAITGRDVIVPPHPELLGALGVALLAERRSRGTRRETVDLAALTAPGLKRLPGFTCGACGLRCSIDRFEVAGRRFPFGGRCSLYEHVWQRRERAAEAEDNVERRGQLMFSPPLPPPATVGEGTPPRVGIPRALTTHSLYPLYAAFWTALGHEVVLSDIDPRGELRSWSGFCLPAQMAHGALVDLERRGVTRVFMPHVLRMPKPDGRGDSYLCPITQAGPFLLAKAFPRLTILAPTLDFAAGFAAATGLVDLAVSELGVPFDQARAAYATAIACQERVEASLLDLGERATAAVLATGRPAVVLVGRSYNAFWPQASQSVGKKLSSRGIPVIPGDCLGPAAAGATSWHYANVIRGALELVKRHDNLFLVFVSNFSCTIDALTEARVAAELGGKPYLFLEIDAHTADAGIETRLEAFLDVVHNYTALPAPQAARPAIARLDPEGSVVTPAGERLPLSSPRVRLFLPTFSRYHAEAWEAAAAWLGLHSGGLLELSRAQLERGLAYTSGRECLPLPLCVGQLLEARDRLAPGEVGGFLMLRAGAPCVVDAFGEYLDRFLAEQAITSMFLIDPSASRSCAGLGAEALSSTLAPAMHAADLMVEIDAVLRVVGGEGAGDELRAAWRGLLLGSASLEAFEAALPAFVALLSRIPRTRDPRSCPRVLLTGDFFSRFSPFFMEGVHERYARAGIIVVPADLGELVQFTVYRGMTATADRWGLAPSWPAWLRACSRAFEPDGRDYLLRWAALRRLVRSARQYRESLASSGLLVGGGSDIERVFERAGRHVATAIGTEAIPSVGRGLLAEAEGYDGVILIGPFNCLPFRIAEAILKPQSLASGLPLIAYESDGCAVPAAFLRQVDAHIQQVLARHAEHSPAACASAVG